MKVFVISAIVPDSEIKNNKSGKRNKEKSTKY